MLALADTPPPQERTMPDPPRLSRCPMCGERYPGSYVVCPADATPLGLASTDDPLLGVVLAGTYRITRVLGGGGMGRLYEADHVRLGRRFAIKVIHEAFARNDDAIARFEREARASSRIRSDHVVDVLDVLRAPDDRPCIVAERLDGEDLQTRLDRIGRMSVAEALPIARQVCRGLAAAHAHGVIHRDLKPSNLFLASGPDGRVAVKILDFGVAKLADGTELTRTGAVVGTPAYMAPEQARGASGVDERADVYGVGAVLYRMLTGRTPYGGGDPTATLARLLHEDPVRPRAIDRGIPAGIEAVVQRAMARDLDARPSTALELERELAAFDASGDAVNEPEPPRFEGGPSEEGKSGPDTLVLPRGSVTAAAEITRRARRARPLAAALVSSAVTSAVLAAAVLLEAGGRWLTDAPLDPSGHTLVAAGALGAGVLTFTVLVRRMRSRWQSAPSVEALARTLGVSVLAGLVVLGGLELIRAGLTVVGAETEHAGAQPAATAIRVGIAAVAMLGASYWTRRARG